MVSLLIHIFIKDYRNTDSPEVRQQYGILSGAVGILFNIILFGTKFLAGLISHSIAITADAFNNLSDAGSSIITLVGFKMAGEKPDPHHPFGHGRIEYISGFLVSIIILLMAIELLRSSIGKILHPSDIDFSPLIVGILVLSILVKLYMFYYNRTMSRKIQSAAMAATALDSISDTLATSVVLLSTLIAHFTGLKIDGWCGTAVGLFILFAGFNAAKDTIGPLLGQAPDPEFVKSIRDLVMSYDEVLGVHDLIVHDYGPGRLMVSLHAEVPAKGDILHLHDTIDNIEKRLRRELSCEAVIHMDPILNDDEETNTLKSAVMDIVKTIDQSLTIHDFRIVKGPTHTNLIFDVVEPYQVSFLPEDLEAMIQQKVQELDPRYFTVVQVDRQ
ncbi:MAG: cation diffusion facilitator family transporter [Lachnospiraceae bacterium]|nr:cation diffusion facilitator family transporter [Lachnospiraceae bacterium]MDD7147538.1 cation diffusion facilitator family transporter [Lachnospiraceae bacterium]MDY4070046.1 cation diffusion facilitator family transporter [Lachnospiraceae bacterium]